MSDLPESHVSADIGMDEPPADEMRHGLACQRDRIRELEAEVAHLRPAAEMAMRFATADKERCDAIHAYNAELKRQRERGIFPVRVDPEYAAMEAAKVYYWAACKKLIEVCGVGSTVSSAPADPG